MNVRVCLQMFLAFALSAPALNCSDNNDEPGDTDALVEIDADTDGGITDGDMDVEPCVDMDGDGYCRDVDCDDENPDVHPGAVEICGNGIDDNCNGLVDEGCLVGTIEYFVDVDSIGGVCSDENPGTSSQPWCTIAKANATLTAGDTVYLRAGVYSGETIRPSASGTSNTRRITYAAYDNEEVTLEGSVYCVRLQDNYYITILGLRLYNCERNIYLQGASHNNIGYCEIDTPMRPTTWAGSRVYEESRYNRFYNNVFSRYGSESYYNDSYRDYGCNLDIGNDHAVDESDYNLIINNKFFHGGHHILGVYSSYNIVRSNTFHNEEWYDCHRTPIGGLCGNRNVILNTSNPDRNIRNVIDKNWIVFSGVPPDQDTSTGLSIRTQYNIVRRNIFYHNDSGGITLSNDGGNHNNSSNNYIYNNVFYHNGYMLFDDWDPRKTGMMLSRWQNTGAYNDIVGVTIKNNIFHENQLHAIYFYLVDEAEQDVAHNWEHEGDPLFVSFSGQPAPSDFGVYDFRLQPGSPCRENGGFLTVTTGSGQESVLLEVENVGYFTDGFGLVPADMILLEGSAGAVVIETVDYEANTIILKNPLTWEAGTGVALPYLGMAPDQGVYENAP